MFGRLFDSRNNLSSALTPLGPNPAGYFQSGGLDAAMLGGATGAVNSANRKNEYEPAAFSDEWCRKVTFMRLSTTLQPDDYAGGRAAIMPFGHIKFYASPKVVHVFLVVNDEAVVLSDSREMFPSDTLVTQLRLLAQ